MVDQAPQDRRAQALAEIRSMQTELMEAHSKIDALERELARSQDTLSLVAEERKTYRDDSLLFRAKLIELATSMANIGMLTTTAQEIMMTIGPLTTSQTQQQVAQESSEASKLLSNLKAVEAAL